MGEGGRDGGKEGAGFGWEGGELWEGAGGGGVRLLKVSILNFCNRHHD